MNIYISEENKQNIFNKINCAIFDFEVSKKNEIEKAFAIFKSKKKGLFSRFFDKSVFVFNECENVKQIQDKINILQSMKDFFVFEKQNGKYKISEKNLEIIEEYFIANK